MKHLQNKHGLALLALVAAATIGGLGGVSAKIALKELPPLTVLFIRLSIMAAVLLPFSGSSLSHLMVHWKKVLLLGILWSGNIILFIVGVNHTTAISSQVIYAGIPVLVLLENALLGTERLLWFQVLGILVGFLGAFTMVLGPIGDGANFGSMQGNSILFAATLSWSLYLIFSKRLSSHLGPMPLTTGPAVVAWIISGFFMVFFEGTTPLFSLSSIRPVTWEALIFLGLGIGVVMIFLYQWGIKHGTTIAASSMIYVSMLVGTISGVVILGESVTTILLVGATLLVVGVFLTTTLPLLKRYASKRRRIV